MIEETTEGKEGGGNHSIMPTKYCDGHYDQENYADQTNSKLLVLQPHSPFHLITGLFKLLGGSHQVIYNTDNK